MAAACPIGLALALASLPACVLAPRMCAAESDCRGKASCVAGRCVAHGATAVIDSARRILFSPVDIAYVRPSRDDRDADVATLGSARDEGSLLLMRFAASLPPEAHVLEAYIVLERMTDVDTDPVPIALRAERVVDPWDGRTISWARQPRFEEVGAPVTRVYPQSGSLVRLEVRGLVQHWRRRAGRDFGIAVVAEGQSTTGIAFAISPAAMGSSEPAPASVAPTFPSSGMVDLHGLSSASVARPRDHSSGPRLELYVE